MSTWMLEMEPTLQITPGWQITYEPHEFNKYMIMCGSADVKRVKGKVTK